MNIAARQSVLSGLPILGLVFLCLFLGKSISAIPFVPLLVVVSVFLFLFAFVYTEHAMILLIIAMLLSPEFVVGAVSKRQNLMVRADDLLIVVFMFAWLARTAIAKNRSFISKLPINRFIFLYCCALIFSTLKGMLAGDVVPLKGFFYVFKSIEYFMVFYLAAGVVRDKKQVTTYLKVFIAVLAIVNIYACTQIGSGRVSAPFEGTEGEPNTLGGYQVLMLAVVLGLLTHCRSLRWKWPLLVLSVFTLIPFSFTLSRASYFAIIPMYLTLIFFAKGRTKNILIGALIVVMIAAFFFLPSIVKERVLYTFTPEIDESIVPVTIGKVTLDPSASARINDWSRLIDTWKKKPFMGVGVTGAGFVDGQFFCVLVESGALGLMAFIFLLWNIFHRSLKIYKNTKDDFYEGLTIGFLAGTVGMVAHAVTANTFVIIRIMEPYWFIAALVMMIPKLETSDPVPAAKETAPTNSYVSNAAFLLKDGK